MKRKILQISVLSLFALAFSPSQAQDMVKLTTSKTAGEQVTLQLNQLSRGATVDWGDGNIVSVSSTSDDLLTVQGTVKGSGAITISSNSKIRTLVCGGNSLTALDVSGAPNLLSLYCQDNSLTTLDVSACTKLTDLNCARNQISKLKVTATTNPLLENINVAANGMTTNTGSGTSFSLANENLQYIDISDNSFTTITFNAKNKNVDVLKCANNSVKRLSLSYPSNLSVVMANGNQLTNLTLNANGAPLLRQVFLDGNSLEKLDLSESTDLQYLSVAENELTTMGLPSKKKLYAISCANNNLTGASLPTTNYKPENFSYLPQDLTVDISSKLKKASTGNYYLTLCPSFSDRLEDDYQLDLSDWAKDTDGSRVTLAYYGANGTEEYAELTKASASNQEGDYFPQSTNANYGKASFLKSFDHVYVTLTAKSYPDLVSQTTGFKVTDSATGISQTQAGDELQVTSLRGMLRLSSGEGVAVRVFSAAGKLVWQGHVEGSPVEMQLPPGVYIVNGQKVVL